MLRIRMAGTLIAALALLASGCGGDTSEVSTLDSPAVEDAGADGSSGDPDASASDSDVSVTSDPGPSDVADTSDSGASSSDGEDGAAATPDESDDAGSADSSASLVPADAEDLVASAIAQLGGSAVRGEAAIAPAPGFKLTTSFESDAQGDLAAAISIPPGLDQNFPAGGEAEMRYVGGAIYVRPQVSADTLAELGLNEAWYEIQPEPGFDPPAGAGSAAGLMCVFPQMGDMPVAECDLVDETAAFLATAGEAEIVGTEDVRGAEATRVRLLVSLLDLAGGILDSTDAGSEDSDEGAFFDDSSETFEDMAGQLLGFLDIDFEVDVWIDAENHLRRLSFDIAAMFGGGPDTEDVPSTVITVDFIDYDAGIDVEAPPPEVIVDDPALLQGDDDFATSEDYDDDYDYEPEYEDDYEDDDYDDDY